MITGGFGATFDLTTGAKRTWVLDDDGVRRYVDTNERVDDEREGTGE